MLYLSGAEISCMFNGYFKQLFKNNKHREEKIAKLNKNFCLNILFFDKCLFWVRTPI